MSSRESFGRRASSALSVETFLKSEAEAGRAGQFALLDQLTEGTVCSALQGGRPLSIESVGSGEQEVWRRRVAVRLTSIPVGGQEFLEDLYSIEKQQSRGTWSLPEAITVKIGVVHFAVNVEQFGRFAHSATAEDRHKVSLVDSPEALYYFAVLEPFFDTIYEPFALRGEQTAKKGKEEQVRRWEAIAETLSALGFAVEQELSVMRYGGGWSKLRSSEQLEAKRKLLAALAGQAQSGVAARHRARRIMALLSRYYKRADRAGKALRGRVLTRELERTLCAYFGGGWLRFLDYLGEEPHPDEQVATALPQPKLFLGTTRKSATEVGLENLDDEQVRLITASLYGGQDSPLERRLEVMRRYWEVFDEAHARQQSGMQPLWGMVAEGRNFQLARRDEIPYQERLYERLLPRPLLSEVVDLWGSKMLSRYPDRIVTEPFPHVAMAEAFGPALRLWQGCALTAWFLCEGPYSRTDMAGLEHYHRRELGDLETLGAPVDRRMFSDLVAAEGRLGPEEPTYMKSIEVKAAPGLTMQTGISTGKRRQGFEILRDVVTRYRRAWTERHLEGYLSACAKKEIHVAAEQFHRMTHQRSGTPPTLKQFAKFAQPPANHWFGGDASALFRAFGERSPVSPKRVREMPEDAHLLVEYIYRTLGGTDEGFQLFIADLKEREANVERAQKNGATSRVANLALEYLQLQEALGRPPTLKEVGKGAFERKTGGLLHADVEQAYACFEEIVAIAKLALREGDGASETLPAGEHRLGPPETPEEAPSELPNNGERELASPPLFMDQGQLVEEDRRRPWWRRLFDG